MKNGKYCCNQFTARKDRKRVDKQEFLQYIIYGKENGLNLIGIQTAEEHLDDTH